MNHTLPVIALVACSSMLSAQTAPAAARGFNYNTLTLAHTSNNASQRDADYNVNTLTWSNRFAPDFFVKLGICFAGADTGAGYDIDSGYEIGFGYVNSLGASTDLIVSLGVQSYDQTDGSSREISSTRFDLGLRQRLASSLELRLSVGRELFSEADYSGALDDGSDRTTASIGLALDLTKKVTLGASANWALPDSRNDNTDTRGYAVSLSYAY